jgi:iron complex transport system substrate-binding protein
VLKETLEQADPEVRVRDAVIERRRPREARIVSNGRSRARIGGDVDLVAVMGRADPAEGARSPASRRWPTLPRTLRSRTDPSDQGCPWLRATGTLGFAMRVVSLLPSATEIVCALGATDELVGVSHECDFPDAIRDRPVLTRSRIDASGPSRAIDVAVRAVIRDAISIYDVDADRLAALNPDVIITQDLCEVCAVSLDDVRAAVARLAHRERVEVMSLRPTLLDHVLGDIEHVARALGRPERGADVRAALETRIGAIAARGAAVQARPRVVTLEWIEPLMVGGTWMPELVDLAGGAPVGATAGAPAPTVDVEALAAMRPDVIVIKPCGFTIDRTLAERDVIERDVIAAAKDARVYLTDGNAFFNRPGPRLVESLEILAACVHPDVFADFASVHHRAIVRLA